MSSKTTASGLKTLSIKTRRPKEARTTRRPNQLTTPEEQVSSRMILLTTLTTREAQRKKTLEGRSKSNEKAFGALSLATLEAQARLRLSLARPQQSLKRTVMKRTPFAYSKKRINASNRRKSESSMLTSTTWRVLATILKSRKTKALTRRMSSKTARSICLSAWRPSRLLSLPATVR